MRRITLLALLLLIGAFGCRSQARPLKPIRPSPTAGGVVISDQPRAVTFQEINSNPAAYINQPIRVSGNFAALARVTCTPFKGPLTEWALLSDGLQMNATGYERVVSLLPEGQGMTVDGIWRFYRGPAGCGKEPPTSGVWYLEITHILQPNPIVQGATVVDLPDDGALPDDGVPPLETPQGGSTDNGFPDQPTEESPLEPFPTEDPFDDPGQPFPFPGDPEPTDDPFVEETAEPLIPPTPTPSATPTPRVPPGQDDDPTETPTDQVSTPAVTPTNGLATATSTTPVPPGSTSQASTATPSVTPTGSLTATTEGSTVMTATPSGGGQLLPSPTPTNEPYPGQTTQTPTATPTEDPYP